MRGTRAPIFFSYHSEEGWLHEHEAAVLQSLLHDITHGAIIRARDGAMTQAYIDGQPVFLKNEEFEETDETRKWQTDEDLALLDYPTRWKRDEHFKKIPSLIRAAPSNELTLSMLAAYSKRFAKRMSVEHQHNVSGGVLVANGPRPAALPEPVQTIDPVSEAITDAVTEGEFTEEQPSGAPPEQKAAPALAPPRAALTALQKDLIEKARAKGLPV